MTLIESTTENIAQAYDIPLDAARKLVQTYTENLTDDPDCYVDGDLTEEGAESVSIAIALGAKSDTTMERLLSDLEEVVAELNAHEGERDEIVGRRDALIRQAMAIPGPREPIVAVTGLHRQRLYQIRDGRR